MYRLLLVVLLHAATTLACRAPPCHWQQNQAIQFENYFNNVATKVINADKAAQNFCKLQGNKNTIETHLGDLYKITLPNAGSKVAYDVQVRGRVLMVIADKCLNGVTEIIPIPLYVDAHAGKYYFNNDDLIVEFPYKFDVTAGGNVCEPVDRAIINLPVETPKSSSSTPLLPDY